MSGDEIVLSSGKSFTSASSLVSTTTTYQLNIGWFNVVTCISPDLLYLQSDIMTRKMWVLEKEMEEFYTVQKSGQLLSIDDMFIGQLVAAVGEDTLWHRGRVDMVNTRAGVATIFFLDYGFTARSPLTALRILPPQFCREAGLSLVARLRGVTCSGQRWGREAVTGLQDILRSCKMRCWVQGSNEGELVDMFVMMPRKQGLGRMAPLSKVLVERGIAVDNGHATVIKREKMWEGLNVENAKKTIMSAKMAMQRIVLSAMTKIAISV